MIGIPYGERTMTIC